MSSPSTMGAVNSERGDRLARRGTRVALRAGLAIVALWLSGCASLPGETALRPEVVTRPDAAADYDVLVGEFASRENRIEEARDAFVRAAEKDPTSPYLHRRVALMSAQLEDGATAIEYAERAVELDPDHEAGRLLLARLYRVRRDAAGVERALTTEDGKPSSMRAGLFLVQVYLENDWNARAIALAKELVEEHPDSIEPWFALTSAYERGGNRQETAETLERAIERHPEQIPLYTRLARLHGAAGDAAGEIEVYQRLLERQPDHYGTLASLGEAYVRSEDLRSAREIYERLAELFPENEGVLQRLAGIDVQLGDLPSARRRLEQATGEKTESGDLLYMLGLVRVESGDPEGALDALGRVPPTHKSYVDARLRIVTLHEEAGDIPLALSVLEELRILAPDRQLDFHTAGMRVRTGDLAGGVALVEEWIEKDPADHEALYQMGIVYDIAERDDEAIEWMRAALDAKPDNAHALNYIGYTWADRGDKLEEAEEMILRALQLEPDDGYITDSLGWVYYKRAKPLVESGRKADAREWLDQSLEALQRAEELSGGDSVISEHLGDLHMLMGDKRSALRFYEQASQQDPRPLEQPDLESKLDRLRREIGSQ